MTHTWNKYKENWYGKSAAGGSFSVDNLARHLSINTAECH